MSSLKSVANNPLQLPFLCRSFCPYPFLSFLSFLFFLTNTTTPTLETGDIPLVDPHLPPILHYRRPNTPYLRPISSIPKLPILKVEFLPIFSYFSIFVLIWMINYLYSSILLTDYVCLLRYEVYAFCGIVYML